MELILQFVFLGAYLWVGKLLVPICKYHKVNDITSALMIALWPLVFLAAFVCVWFIWEVTKESIVSRHK
jgi:hypothetical protein